MAREAQIGDPAQSPLVEYSRCNTPTSMASASALAAAEARARDLSSRVSSLELLSRLSRAEAAAEALAARVDSLEMRGTAAPGTSTFAALAEQLSQGACTPGGPGDEGGGPARVREGCARGLLERYFLYHVPEELGYYKQELAWRADLLKSPVESLCKTLLFRNTKCTREDCSDWRNSRLYAVVTPYARKVDAERLRRAVAGLWSLGRNGEQEGGGKREGKGEGEQEEEIEEEEDRGARPGRARYNFQLLDSAESPAVTGFGFNGVAPIGLATREVPLLVDASVAALKTGYFWAGGGNPHVKLLLPTAALCVPGVAVAADKRSREVLAGFGLGGGGGAAAAAAAATAATARGDRPRVIVADFTVAR